MARFEGKVALVTGGSSGIGRMLSERLRQEGAAVVVADVSEPTPTDVSDATSVRECVDRLLAAHGRLDVVFSNAGILLAENVETMDEAAFDRTLAVNLKGAFLVAKHVWEYSGKGAEAKLLSGVPMHRQARAEEVVAPMLFLASDEASYITGEVLIVDGGLMAVR